MAKASPAIRKRQQISNASKAMFLWVAGASALVAIALVGAYFLFNKLTFNEKVLAEKSNTVSTLRANNEAVPDLQDNVRVLSTSELLEDARIDNEDSPLQAVLDALPADGNSLAFGASLQQKLLGEVDGLTIESTVVDPVAGVETNDSEFENTEDASVDGEGDEHNQVFFRFTVNGNDSQLREALRRLEMSIRPIAVTSVVTETANNDLRMTVEGYTYYQPARIVELKDKTVSP